MKTLEELGISPAPWTASGGHWVEYGDYAENDMSGAFETFAIPDTEEAPANARLIAAAPELYQAVVDLLDICGNIEEYIGVDPATCGKIEAARKAVAKAGGER